MNTAITFLIADNQDITRAGLQAYISSMLPQPSIVHVHQKKGLIQALGECDAGVVILDYSLFDIQGVEELLILVRRFPAVQWVLFSAELSESLIRRLSAEPHIGMILKENSADEIRLALKCAAEGQRFLCHQISNLLICNPELTEIRTPLTAAETDILRLIAHGLSVKEIASERNSSIHTIATHKKNIFRKLGVNNVYEATKYALWAGLVEMADYYI